jgi:hypothetical protein
VYRAARSTRCAKRRLGGAQRGDPVLAASSRLAWPAPTVVRAPHTGLVQCNTNFVLIGTEDTKKRPGSVDSRTSDKLPI